MNGNHQRGGSNYYAGGGGTVGMENDYAKEREKKTKQNRRLDEGNKNGDDWTRCFLSLY